MTVNIADPRSARATASNWEKHSWVFMRVSGVVLFFLVLGHLFIMNLLDGGVSRINFAFVAGRWSSPFWQIWDLTMLWLAMIHGANGMRTVINDYATKPTTRWRLRTLLYVVTVFIIGLGTLVIFTFDPGIA